MKRILMLLLAVLMCFTVVACSSKDDEPDLAGTTLEGLEEFEELEEYKDVPFKKLVKTACENAEKEMKEDDDVDSCEVTYKFSYGWDTDKFDESDYIGSKQSAVTCTISMTATSEGHTMRATVEFYFVHNHEANTLKAVGIKSYQASANSENTYYGEGDDVLEMLEDLLSDEY